jgi:hypothetical protein
MNPLETMNAEIAAADKAAARAVRAAYAGRETKPCGRCNGKGYDFFCGGARAPGVCFRCAGTGTALARRADTAAVKAVEIEAELSRLRAVWAATVKAIKALDPATRGGAYEIKRLTTHLEAIRTRAADTKAAA